MFLLNARHKLMRIAFSFACCSGGYIISNFAGPGKDKKRLFLGEAVILGAHAF